MADSTTLVEKEQTVQTGHPSTTDWVDAQVGQALEFHERLRTGPLSRAAVRLSDLSVLRVNELTTIEILPPQESSDKPGLDLKSGAMYFFSREKAQEQDIQTPVATGALQGTEFYLSVAADGHTKLAVFDGKVDLKNSFGRVSLVSGEVGDVDAGHAPTKTAMIEATNIIQWCLYYPGVVDTNELQFPAGGQAALAPSLNAYREGDLLGALKLYPRGTGSTMPPCSSPSARWTKPAPSWPASRATHPAPRRSSTSSPPSSSSNTPRPTRPSPRGNGSRNPTTSNLAATLWAP
jgi:hypothetical protein